jgi:quercetin dioxygenase-like cupin family protein
MKIVDLKTAEEKDATREPLFVGGTVKTQFVLDEEFRGSKIQIVNVKFAAGARNKFHTHSNKQVLFVIEGEGIVADRKQEYKLVPGMAVIIPAGEEHWHGATKKSTFAHLSMIGQPQEMKITE